MGKEIKIAIIDLYEGEANQGMRCIGQLVEKFKRDSHYPITFDFFDLRSKLEIPSLEFDVFISSGGPGSPLTTAGADWETKYFRLMDDIQEHNRTSGTRKFVFLICHSFQIFCRYYGFAKVTKRRSTAFGVMPIYKTKAGKSELIFMDLDDPFWTIDSRDYQITEPNLKRIAKLGGHVLCLEKMRPLIPLDRAVMAIRFNDEIIGTQFHPEADSDGMYMYLTREDKKQYVVQKYGLEKYTSMLQALNDPEKVRTTYRTIIPSFFQKIQNYHDTLRTRSL